MADNNALELVFLRNAFYKRLYYLVLSAFCLSFILIGVLIYILSYMLRNPTEPLYFATDEIGRLIKVIPVNVPNISDKELFDWTIKAIEETFSIDYINYRRQLQTAQKYFTNYGWKQYMRAFTASNNLIAVTERKFVVIAQAVSEPKIKRRGLLGGAYAWEIEMPMLFSYLQPPAYDNQTKIVNPVTVSVIVQRQPILQSYKGLGILQVVATYPATINQPQELTTPPAG